jgi:penicillin amidase
MGRIAKWLAASAGLSVLLGLLGAGGGFLWLRSSLPQIEGTLTLAGLSAPVQVLRDGDGLVTIRAEGEADAAFALGFVHAQDRLWQMDAMRRIVAGRLSEVTGPATLDTDRLMRTLGLYRKAEESLALMAPEIRTLMQAYSDGVNGFLATRSGALPPEFLLLGYEPEPWRPVHSLLWGQIMALRLSGNWRNELLRARLAGQLSEEQIEELWPAEPPDGPITLGAATGDIGPAANAAPDDIGRAAEAAFSLLAGVPQDLLGPGASNSWVLSGAQTASGKPVLANDPHLGFIVPGTWYLVRIETPEGTRAGATAPGVPAIIIGHNGRIAWGFTTTHSDTQDFVIEKFDPTDPKRYLTPEGPLPFQIRDEVIRVKGEDPMVHRVQSTRHGPVLSDVEPDVRRSHEALARQGHAATALALAWPALSHPNRTAEALFRLNRAGDWGEFVEALRLFHAPQQNIVYADTAGNIGFFAPARVPIRLGYDGRRPVPGWDRDELWSGFIPFEALPQAFNPPRGRFVNANNRIVPPGYAYRIASHPKTSYRARRIESLLDAQNPHDPEASAGLQQDHVSLMAHQLLPLMLVRAPSGGAALEAHRRLASWDGAMDRDGAEPLIFAAWLRELNRALYADELGKRFADLWHWQPRFVAWVLTDGQHWCDDVTSAEPEDCSSRIELALERALASLERRYGGDMEAWRWGEAHKLRFAHPVFRHVPLLDDLSAVEEETDGGPYTVNRGTPRFASERRLFGHAHGAGLRTIFDLSDLDGSRFMTAFGQSGNPLSPHYGDLTRPWRDGTYLSLAGGAQLHRLTLAPPQ